MRSWSISKLMKVLAALLSVIVLTSCGNNSPTIQHAISTAPPLPDRVRLLHAGSGIGFDIVGNNVHLHIQSPSGIACPGPIDTIVLETDHLTYDSGSKQQMIAYLDTAFANGISLFLDPSAQSKPYPSLPAVFRLIPLATTGDSSPTVWPFACKAYMQVTNTGLTPFQLSGIDIRLTADSYLNTNHYRVVDICSPDNHYCPPGGLGSPSVEYEYGFYLKKGNSGALYQGIKNGKFSSPTLLSGQTIEVSFNIFAIGTPADFTYALLPELSLDTANGPIVLVLPQLASEIAFVNENQLSCYRMQENRFVQIDPRSGSSKQGVWCFY